MLHIGTGVFWAGSVIYLAAHRAKLAKGLRLVAWHLAATVVLMAIARTM